MVLIPSAHVMTLEEMQAKSRAANKKWRENNKERNAAKFKAWVEKNKAHRAAYARQRRKEMPGRYAAIKGKYLASKRGNPIVDPAAIVQWMEDWHKKELVLCYWCAKQFKPSECQADHVIPIWKGGAHSLDNLVICCEGCNRHKNKTMPEVFRAKLSKQAEMWLSLFPDRSPASS